MLKGIPNRAIFMAASLLNISTKSNLENAICGLFSSKSLPPLVG